jgi:hypothetical protein
MTNLLDRLAVRLSGASQNTVPAPIEWPDTIDTNQWFMSPELISLYGTPLWDRLDETVRRRLSFFEAVNFFSLNIHGEKPLVAGLADRLYSPEFDSVSAYLHHFLAEENRHMDYFARFCRSYAGKIYPEKRFAIPRDMADGEQDIVFFAQTLIFELIVDHYNNTIANDERITPLARSINRLHHKDEIRHLIFGRMLLSQLWAHYRPKWNEDTRAAIRDELLSFITITWQQYYNPDVYVDAGIPDPYETRDLAWTADGRIAFRASIERSILVALRQAGIVNEEHAR